MMIKTPVLFDERNEKAKALEFGDKKHSASVGEVWRYMEGINIGNEISKDGSHRRPCIILKNNTGNGLLLVIPLTTHYHAWMEKYYFHIHNPDTFGIKGGYAILNQVKLIDTKRLIYKLSPISLSRETIKLILYQYYNL